MWGCSYSQICSNFYLQRGEKQATNFPHLYLGQVIDLTFSKITEVYGRALVAGRVADAQLASPGFALATFYLRALVWAFSFRNNCFLLQNICFPKYLLLKLIYFAFQICHFSYCLQLTLVSLINVQDGINVQVGNFVQFWVILTVKILVGST